MAELTDQIAHRAQHRLQALQQVPRRFLPMRPPPSVVAHPRQPPFRVWPPRCASDAPSARQSFRGRSFLPPSASTANARRFSRLALALDELTLDVMLGDKLND